MKIVNRKTFLQMPKGTIFSEYEPCVFYGLFVKTSVPGDMVNDYFEIELVGNPAYNSSGEFLNTLVDAEETGGGEDES